MLVKQTGTHFHTEEDRDVMRRQALQQMKEEILSRPDLSCRDVYQKVLQEKVDTFEGTRNVEEVGAALPTYNNVRTILQRHRSTVRPNLPARLEDIDLEGVWTQTKKGEGFLLFDDVGSPQNPKPRLLGFATHRNLEILFEARPVFMDGTFRVVPPQFAQLYTLHASYMGQMLPLAYFLLADKEKDTYIRVFELLRSYATSRGLVFQPPKFHIDFEAATIVAIRETFPGAEVKGCNFHYTQAVWRKVQRVGLTTFYKEDPAVRK